MNKELKEQAHKEFDEKFAVKHYTDGKVDIPFGIHEEYRKIIKSFLDSLIDKTVQMTEERIVGELKKGLLNRMMKYNSKDGYSTLHDEILEKVSNDVDDIFSIITNKSDINK